MMKTSVYLIQNVQMVCSECYLYDFRTQFEVNILLYIERSLIVFVLFRFYLCQWLRDEVQTAQIIQFYQNRWNSKSPFQDFGIALSPLSRDAALRISRALGQQRPLARGLDKILERLLVIGLVQPSKRLLSEVLSC